MYGGAGYVCCKRATVCCHPIKLSEEGYKDAKREREQSEWIL